MEDLDALKSDSRVLQIYAKYVRGLKKAGTLYTGCCPLHADSSPSFSVYPDMRWTCFSGPSCGSGNIFQLLERHLSIPFKEAVELVKKELGDPDSWQKDRVLVDSVFKPVAESKTYKVLPISKADEIAETLSNFPQAVHYLDNRGVSLETAKKFKIGFRQTIKFQDPKAADILDKGWVLFPYIDDDVVRQVKFRSLARKKPGGFQRSPGMETVLFNVNTIDPFDPVYLTSGEFDAMILEQAGFHAVSLMSDSHKPTPAQKDQLMQASMVVLAGDTDESGNGIMDKLWRELGNRAYKLSWPIGTKDANECFLKHCKRDNVLFRALVEELTTKAKSNPMPAVYSLQETLLSGEETTLSENPDRLRFPWASVDKMANILPGDILGIGSTNTGMAKTTLALQITMYNARKYGRCILNYQTEMRPSEIATMAAAQILRKDRNFLTNEDKKTAAAELQGVQYFVGCDPMLSDINAVLDLLEAGIRRLSPYAVVLDHFHHLTTGMDNEVRVQSAAMTRIKQIAETYKIVFINVGQPRKATQQSKGKQIHITDFKGSGAWGDASNAVLAIHRDLNKAEDPTQLKGVYEDKTLIKLLKGRSQGVGNSAAYLTFFGEFASFEQLESNYEEVPSEIN
jgi:hypothetical protein